MSPDQILQHSLNLAYFFLKFRPRTEKEIREYLKKKSKRFNLTLEIIETTINKLREENLIDDSQFVAWFIEQRNSAKPKSQFFLQQELLRFGIEKNLIDDYFLCHQPDELALAQKALQKKPSLLKNIKDKKQYQKAFNFLLRRGFSIGTSRNALKVYLSN